jgi:threonine 3-dehydrogenase
MYGAENVIASDIRIPIDGLEREGPFEQVDVLDKLSLEKLIRKSNTDTLIHLSALLSAVGEKNVDLALSINVDGFRNVLTLARDLRLRIYCPSTIGAFGPMTPRIRTPDITIMQPTTIYGVTKVFMERLGEYFHLKYGVDFRSLRYPGVISVDAPPGGGTTDYAVDIFHQALKHGTYQCFLRADTELPMIYVADCLQGTIQFLETPSEKLTQRVYNLASISFTPAQLGSELQKHLPHFKMTYTDGDFRQQIADSWPKSLDDTHARRDWNWKPAYNLSRMVETILTRLKGTHPSYGQMAEGGHL